MTYLVEVLADQVCLDIPAGRPVGMHVDRAGDLDDATRRLRIGGAGERHSDPDGAAWFRKARRGNRQPGAYCASAPGCEDGGGGCHLRLCTANPVRRGCGNGRCRRLTGSDPRGRPRSRHAMRTRTGRPSPPLANQPQMKGARPRVLRALRHLSASAASGARRSVMIWQAQHQIDEHRGPETDCAPADRSRWTAPRPDLGYFCDSITQSDRGWSGRTLTEPPDMR
jgi:hypothetical protein